MEYKSAEHPRAFRAIQLVHIDIMLERTWNVNSNDNQWLTFMHV